MPYIMKNKRKPGIYQIVNLDNGNTYIGSSKDVAQRLLAHRFYLRNNRHENQHLQNAWNKYGEDSFIFTPLVYCEVILLNEYESRLIRTLKPSYNKSMTFDRYDGVPWTDERRAKFLRTIQGRKRSPKHCESISRAKAGDGHHLRKFLSVEIDEFRKVCAFSGKALGKIAKAWGISPSYASRLSRGERRVNGSI